MAEGKKFDQKKPRFGLVPPMALREVAEILTHGAEKYGAENWRKVTPLEERYLDATLRHINQYQCGDAYDEESGRHHLAHAICSLLFIIENEFWSKT